MVKMGRSRCRYARLAQQCCTRGLLEGGCRKGGAIGEVGIEEGQGWVAGGREGARNFPNSHTADAGGEGSPAPGRDDDGTRMGADTVNCCHSRSRPSASRFSTRLKTMP